MDYLVCSGHIFGLFVKIFPNNFLRLLFNCEEILITILIIIINTPSALPPQLSVKTSNSSVVEDSKGHDGKKNLISNYPVWAKILSLLAGLLYSIRETEPLWEMLSDKHWCSSSELSDGKSEVGAAAWPKQTDQNQIYTLVHLKDIDYWLMLQLTPKDK